MGIHTANSSLMFCGLGGAMLPSQHAVHLVPALEGPLPLLHQKVLTDIWHGGVLLMVPSQGHLGVTVVHHLPVFNILKQ